MLVKCTKIKFRESPSVVSRVDTCGRTDKQTGREMDGPADRYDETNRRFYSFLRKCLIRKEQCITDVKEEKHTQGTEEIALRCTDM
jgi:hypothetical protein